MSVAVLRSTKTVRFLVLGLLLAPPAWAQIVTDGTVGPRATLSGPNLTVGAELGTTKGTNLFHSFQDFNIRTGETATFTGPATIRNVIGRVTGGRVSSIDGTLRSTVGQADVYLINPAGVVMGPNATVDVPASLHVGTADELRFQDGSRYSARDPAASTLTVAAPEAFGFLTPQPAALTLTGSQLAVPPGKTLSLTAGDVTIAGSSERRASLTAPGGTLRVEAVGATGGAAPVDAPSAAPGSGTLTVEQADLDTSGDGGGRLAVRAGAATLTEAMLVAENRGATDADDTDGIDIAVTGSLVLDGGSLFADTAASGRSGMARIQAGDLRLDYGSYITSDSYRAEGDAGTEPIGAAAGATIQVAGALELLNGSDIHSSTWTEGDAGMVTVRAGNARLDNGGLSDRITGIASQANRGSSGAAGDVTLEIAGLLEVLNGAVIGSGTRASGSAGTVTVRAGSARLDNRRVSGQFTGIASQANRGSSGAAGDVTLETAGLLEVLNGAQIGSGTFAVGDAGTVTVRAGSARLDDGGTPDQVTGVANQAEPGSSGAAGDVTLEIAGLLEMLNGAQVSSSTFAISDAGTVTVRAGSARLDNGGLPDQVTGLSSQAIPGSSGAAGDVTLEIAGFLEVLNGAHIGSDTFAGGDAGTVTVRAGSARLDGGGLSDQFTGLASQASSASSGAAGDVTLEIVGFLEVLNGARISSSTFATGNAGTTTVRADQVLVDRGGAIISTGIFSSAGSRATGAVGDVRIAANRLDLRRGGTIAIAANQLAPAVASTPGGVIQIDAEALRLESGSRITTESKAADAGAIVIGGGLLYVQDSLIATSAAGATGNGGDITLTPRQLILDGGFIQANTAAPGARGGDIVLDTQALIASQGTVEIGGTARQTFAAGSGRNIIQAAAPGGERGTIQVTAPNLDLSAALAPLRTPAADPDALLADACRAARGARPSTLVEHGLGGMPADPAAPASLPFGAARLERILAN